MFNKGDKVICINATGVEMLTDCQEYIVSAGGVFDVVLKAYANKTFDNSRFELAPEWRCTNRPFGVLTKEGKLWLFNHWLNGTQILFTNYYGETAKVSNPSWHLDTCYYIAPPSELVSTELKDIVKEIDRLETRLKELKL